MPSDDEFTPDPVAQQFIRPECGSRVAGQIVHVTTVFEEGNPWSSVLKRIGCSECRAVIPAHLAERWNNLSVEAAQTEWRNTFRESQKENNEWPRPSRRKGKKPSDDPGQWGNVRM